jgi:hypothetical protein
MYAAGRKLGTIAAILFVTSALAACDIAVDGHGGFDFGLAAGKAQDQWTRNYKVAAGARLELINVNGRINAEPTDGSEIELTAERTAKAASDEAAKDLLGRIEMREEAGADRVRVEVRPPRISGPSGHEFKWTVKVPRGVSVDLRTVNGGVHIKGLDAEVRARSTNGGVTATALSATSLDAAVTNGGVEIELARAVTSGTFDIEAVNGGVSIMLPEDSKADISGRCVNGGISVSQRFPLETVGEQSRRRVDAKLNGGGAKISLETVNGGVRIGPIGSATNESH